MKKRLSFKIKVLVPIILIFLASVLIISSNNYLLLDSIVENKTNAALEMFIGNISAQINHLDIILDSTKKTLAEKHIAMARTVAYILDNAGRDFTVQELQTLAASMDIIELNIADKEGNIINSNKRDYIGDNFNTSQATIQYLALARGEAAEISEAPRRTIRPDLSLGDIIHYTGVARRAGGFVQLGFKAEVIERLQDQININKAIKETRIGNNGFGFVIHNGIIISHPSNNFINRNVLKDEWYNKINEGSGFSWIEIDINRYYAGYKNINNNTIAALVPQSDYYRELNRVTFETLVFLFIAIILISGVMYFILTLQLMPVKHLVKGLGIIAENLDARIQGSYNDEFDEIKDAVNSMAGRVKEHVNMISGIEYASKIQKNLLPPESVFKEAFEDYACVWQPKDIVGGDIYWMKNFDKGSVLCFCDCTGHGTPGALLTMLVSSAFEAVVKNENCDDTALVISELDKKLVFELNVDTASDQKGININDGCDLAVLFIAKDGSINISSGNTYVFVCDGKDVTRIKGQKIMVGDGSIKNKEDVKTVKIKPNKNNKFYIASDGLYEQIGGGGYDASLPFGFDIIEKTILEEHYKNQDYILKKLMDNFENYRGDNQRRDDLQIIAFKPRISNEEGG
ncbi:MAG: SpoIIE family protein phosphatase [Treponema sp.]|nr:SpoIIE family protein phosphatase [Treponema sp.]MCL2237843.1 SpoIIE family protein phosphatase [Treponema sp.]